MFEVAHLMPGMPLIGVPGTWPTTDGALPWKLFLYAVEHTATLRARSALVRLTAELLASGRIWGSKDEQDKVTAEIDALTDQAYPE